MKKERTEGGFALFKIIKDQKLWPRRPNRYFVSDNKFGVRFHISKGGKSGENAKKSVGWTRVF